MILARKTTAVLSSAAACIALAACDPAVGGQESIGAGSHKVTSAIYGIWKAKNASPGCVYSLRNTSGTLIWSQKYSKKNQTPSVLLGTGNKNSTFSTNGKCGIWTR